MERSLLDRQCAVIDTLRLRIAELVERHRTKRRLWMPSEMMKEVPESVSLPGAVVVMLCQNTLTELGLPHFHGLLMTHAGMGPKHPLALWTNTWTGEEDRHGAVLSMYLQRVEGLSQGHLDVMRHAYLEAGFNPDWQGSPYQLIAYTVFQEVATQFAHENVGHLLRKQGEEDFGLGRILKGIAGEEARHGYFYRSLYDEILTADPEEGMLSLERSLRNFSMPGSTIPGFSDLEYLAARTEVFDPAQLAGIVDLTIVWLRLPKRFASCELSEKALHALRNVLAMPKILRRRAAQNTLAPVRVVTTPLLPGWQVTI